MQAAYDGMQPACIREADFIGLQCVIVGVDARMQSVDDRMQSAYGRMEASCDGKMQAACIPSGASASCIQKLLA